MCTILMGHHAWKYSVEFCKNCANCFVLGTVWKIMHSFAASQSSFPSKKFWSVHTVLKSGISTQITFHVAHVHEYVDNGTYVNRVIRKHRWWLRQKLVFKSMHEGCPLLGWYFTGAEREKQYKTFKELKRPKNQTLPPIFRRDKNNFICCVSLS